MILVRAEYDVFVAQDRVGPPHHADDVHARGVELFALEVDLDALSVLAQLRERGTVREENWHWLCLNCRTSSSPAATPAPGPSPCWSESICATTHRVRSAAPPNVSPIESATTMTAAAPRRVSAALWVVIPWRTARYSGVLIVVRVPCAVGTSVTTATRPRTSIVLSLPSPAKTVVLTTSPTL